MLRTGVVVVRLIGAGCTYIGGHVPELPLGIPLSIYLVGLEDKILHRYPAPLYLLAVLKLLSEVLLEGSREGELVVVVDVPFELSLEGEML